MINEAKALIKSGGEEDALDLLDSVNWRKIRNVNVLIEISNLYEQLGHIEDSKTLLMFAHEKSPIGRMILYHLTLVCIKMGEIDEAEQYTEEFVQIAPYDSKKFILRYHIAKAKNADIKEQIKILEEMKESDFIEEWAFELAYLYHRAGETEKCTALCDEIIIWFGDGPYVAKALELKMLYSPLEDEQAEKYQELQNQRRGVTHFKANEMLESGEVVRHDIDIATVQEAPEHFNTVNLQAEIKRNIEEIMEATKEGDVNDNLENIKELIEDIPYLQVQETLDEVADKQKKEGKELDDSIKDRFQKFLDEENDGQISLMVDEDSEEDEQIEGQITIQDVMDNWAKMQRAAEETLESAEDIKLKQAKENAIEEANQIMDKEANQIMDKLEDVMPKLEAGVTTSEIMKEEVLNQAEESKAHAAEDAKAKAEEEAKAKAEEEARIKALEEARKAAEDKKALEAKSKAEEDARAMAAELAKARNKDLDQIIEETKENKPAVKGEDKAEEKAEPKSYSVPKFSADGKQIGTGIEIPVVESDKAHVIGEAKVEGESVVPAAEGTSQWKPPVLSDEEIKSSKLLRNEDEHETTKLEEASKIVEDINKSMQNQIDEEIRKQKTLEKPQAPTPKLVAKVEEQVVPTPKPIAPAVPIEDPDIRPIDDDLEEAEVEFSTEVDEPEVQRMPSAWENSKTRVLPVIEEENIDDTQRLAGVALGESLQDDFFKPEVDEEEDEDLPEIEEVEEEQEDGDALIHLTKEERETFSYFMPIDGMELALCKAISGTKKHLQGKRQKGGHIIVQGIQGTGKTKLATSLVKVLQGQVGMPSGNIGKVDGDKLNGKDIGALFAKIPGGCLIIEKAGQMNRETILRLSIMIENDQSGILIILEDTKTGIDRIMKTSPELSKEFTELINIPPFTIDELVEFAKAYADDCECVIDEMGILAIYDRINIIQSLDHPTALSEVKEIMDEAMENADKGGFKKAFERFSFGNKKYDENGYMILREKDFQKYI